MLSRRSPTRLAVAAAVLVAVLIGATACRSSGPSGDSSAGSSANSSGGGTPTTNANPGTVTTTTPEGAGTTLFTALDGLLVAFAADDPTNGQVLSLTTAVDPADPTSTAENVRVHDQACFFGDGTKRFLMPVEAGPPTIPTPTWGVFQLSGDRVGAYEVEMISTLGSPSFQPTAAGEAPRPYGCASLRDGRLVTTDLGGSGVGEANGQVTVWFPPFDRTTPVTACKLDVALATPQGVWVDDQDRVYVASPAAPTAGVWRYSRLPTRADADGGCGGVDPVGSPQADPVRRQSFIAASADHGLTGPSGLAVSSGRLAVSSPISGVINSYDANGELLATMLAPAADDALSSTRSFRSGTPQGLAADGDTLYIADPRWLLGAQGALGAPGGPGAIESLGLSAGQGSAAPTVVLDELNTPTNVTVFNPNGGGTGSKL